MFGTKDQEIMRAWCLPRAVTALVALRMQSVLNWYRTQAQKYVSFIVLVHNCIVIATDVITKKKTCGSRTQTLVRSQLRVMATLHIETPTETIWTVVAVHSFMFLTLLQASSRQSNQGDSGPSQCQARLQAYHHASVICFIRRAIIDR